MSDKAEKYNQIEASITEQILRSINENIAKIDVKINDNFTLPTNYISNIFNELDHEEIKKGIKVEINNIIVKTIINKLSDKIIINIDHILSDPSKSAILDYYTKEVLFKMMASEERELKVE